MNNYALYITLLLTYISTQTIAVTGSCQVAIVPTKQSSWNSGVPYSSWTVQLVPTAHVTSLVLQFSAPSALDQVWQMTKVGSGIYSIPDYVENNGGIKPSSPYSFGYIIQSDKAATITIKSITCAGSTKPATTNTPTNQPIVQQPSTQAPTQPAVQPTQPPTTQLPSATPSPRITTAPSVTSTPTTVPTSPPTSAPTTPAPTTPPTTRAPATAAPTTPPTTRAPATSAPTSAPISFDKVCDVVLVIDNYVVRANPDLAALREKYTSYFSDIDYFYRTNFNVKMNLLHMHFEEGAPFSATNNDGELLDAFRSALLGGFFGTEIPSSACAYHLITGRNPPGIGGLAWVGTACDANLFNTGFSVDVQGQEPPIDVIRRMAHEIGHNFGGQHYDHYSENPMFTCDAGITKEGGRVLRSVQETDYTYMSNSLFISECATATMKSSMPSFPCLWGASPSASTPSATLYEERSYQGTQNKIFARNGATTKNECYNIVYPYGSQMSSFRASGNVKGIRFFENMDCVGEKFEFATKSSSYVGDAYAARANSFQFIL